MPLPSLVESPQVPIGRQVASAARHGIGVSGSNGRCKNYYNQSIVCYMLRTKFLRYSAVKHKKMTMSQDEGVLRYGFLRMLVIDD